MIRILILVLFGSCFFPAMGKRVVSFPDSLEYKVIGKVVVLGNKKTKLMVIQRELTIHEGDTLSAPEFDDLLQRNKQNLTNTALFNFVEIHAVDRGKRVHDIYINLTERWYFWPGFIFELADRNFNVWLRRNDWSRLNYGLTLTRYNFRGRRESWQMLIRLGTWQQYRFAYSIPYLGKLKRSGLNFSYAYLRNRELGYTSINNKLIFFRDPGAYIRSEHLSRLAYTYRRGIYVSQTLEARHNQSWISDTLRFLTDDYFLNNRLNTSFFSLHYQLVDDHRDVRYYPLDGYLFASEISLFGLGLLPEEDFSYLRFQTEGRYYKRMATRWFAGGMLKMRMATTPLQPYYLMRALGYSNDIIRGFEYYVIDGQGFALTKAHIKYQLLKRRELDYGFGPEQFSKSHHSLFLNLFFDAGYVHDRVYFRRNTLSNTWLYGYGLGLDYVTTYDRVFRFEVAMNSLREPGFFFHYGISF